MFNHNAVYALYPNVKSISDIAGAFDENGNKVEIDLNAMATKAAELQAAKAQAEQDAANHKSSALAKLTALGLTQDEVKALLG